MSLLTDLRAGLYEVHDAVAAAVAGTPEENRIAFARTALDGGHFEMAAEQLRAVALRLDLLELVTRCDQLV